MRTCDACGRPLFWDHKFTCDGADIPSAAEQTMRKALEKIAEIEPVDEHGFAAPCGDIARAALRSIDSGEAGIEIDSEIERGREYARGYDAALREAVEIIGGVGMFNDSAIADRARAFIEKHKEKP